MLLNRRHRGVQDIVVKTVFSKLLAAQVLTVVLALLVVTALTRYSLHRGFMDYLEKQETVVLGTLAPALAGLYESRGDWDFLRNNPREWERIWRQSRPLPHDRPGPPRGPGSRPGFPPPGGVPEAHLLRWMRSLDRPVLRDRLFLLDENRRPVAGAVVDRTDELSLQPVETDSGVVGWVGFAGMGPVLPPDAQRFLRGQVRLMAISLTIALVLAAVLAFLLARHLSLPMRRLSSAVDDLARGHYEVRAEVGSQDEIGRLGNSVNQLAETLQKNRSARQRWIADIAHELRTPVAIMKGELESIADGVRQVDLSMTESLKEEINQLASLVDDLQTLALSDAGALNVIKEPVDLSEMLAQSSDGFGQRLGERRIKLELDPGQNITLSGDQQRLKQLLHNLLENSCRYVDAGGTVYLSVEAGEHEVGIVLEDSGPGVSDEQLERLFDRFYRAESSRSRATGGSGLGLSICKNIAEAHGGSIEASHSPRGGLRIRISLPTG